MTATHANAMPVLINEEPARYNASLVRSRMTEVDPKSPMMMTAEGSPYREVTSVATSANTIGTNNPCGNRQ